MKRARIARKDTGKPKAEQIFALPRTPRTLALARLLGEIQHNQKAAA
jgi:hypothetical protein